VRAEVTGQHDQVERVFRQPAQAAALVAGFLVDQIQQPLRLVAPQVPGNALSIQRLDAHPRQVQAVPFIIFLAPAEHHLAVSAVVFYEQAPVIQPPGAFFARQLVHPI